MSGLRETITEEPAGREAAALAAKAVEAGSLTEHEAHRLLVLAAVRGSEANSVRDGIGPKVGAALARDSLRVAARITPRWNARDQKWPDNFIAAMVGASFDRPVTLDTEVQLDSLAAVVEFTVRDSILEHFTATSYGTGSGSLRQIENVALDALLRERPHDLDRILGYIEEHDIVTLRTEDVAGLREWIEATEETPALGDGWL